LRELIKKFLSDIDEKARKIIKPFEQDTVSHEQVTAGVSLFYFEEESRNWFLGPGRLRPVRASFRRLAGSLMFFRSFGVQASLNT